MSSQTTITKPYASLYVGDLSPDVTESLLLETFRRIGPVSSIRVCRDSLTRRSLQYAYVNFEKSIDAERALESLNNQYIKGKPCRIMWSQRDPSIRKSGIGNIFIKDLDPSVEHKELFETFSYFGTILSCKIATDEQGRSKGFGFVHFDSEDAADSAISKVNGKVIKTKQVYVGKFVSKRERLKLAEHSWTNVFVKDIDPDVTDEEFRAKFSQFGKITSAVISRGEDKKSKGFGFVNYETHENAMNAVQKMNGQTLGEKQIWCARFLKRAERDAILKKSLQQKKMDRMSQYQGTNLYVKNIEDDINEERLRREFSPWGNITSLKIMKDDKTAVNRGFGFISFSAPEEAKRAIVEMNNRILQGFTKPLYVNLHEPKDIRRAKLEQQLQTRKMPRAPASYPVFYNNMPPPYVYPPPPQQMAPVWPNPYPVPIPNMPHPGMNTNIHPPPLRQPPPQQAPPLQRSQKTPRNRDQPYYPTLEQFQNKYQSEEEQKDFIGNELFNIISKKDKKRAGKITGMLLGSDIPLAEIYGLLLNQEQLQTKIAEAQTILSKIN